MTEEILGYRVNNVRGDKFVAIDPQEILKLLEIARAAKLIVDAHGSLITDRLVDAVNNARDLLDEPGNHIENGDRNFRFDIDDVLNARAEAERRSKTGPRVTTEQVLQETIETEGQTTLRKGEDYGGPSPTGVITVVGEKGPDLVVPPVAAPDAEVMERAQIVSEMEGLYPPDCEFNATRATGRELLIEALCENWRTLPIEVLRTFKMLSIRKDHAGI